MFVAIFIGIIGYSMSKAGVISVLNGSSESETLIIKAALLLSKHGVLAVVMAGLILSGILACTMSTADSQLLAAASSVSHNLIGDCFGVKLSQKASMLLARLTVIGIAVVGVSLHATRIPLFSRSSPLPGQDLVQASDRSSCSLFSGNGRPRGALAGMLTAALWSSSGNTSLLRWAESSRFTNCFRHFCAPALRSSYSACSHRLHPAKSSKNLRASDRLLVAKSSYAEYNEILEKS